MASNSAELKTKVLLGMTGGIGIVKGPQIVSLLMKNGCDVRVVLTPSAAKLASPAAFEALTAQPVGVEMFTRQHPWEIQHISWPQWADGMLIAPATANTIGKMTCGIADNLLTAMFLAASCPVMAVPAMNTNMYLSPAVQANLEVLRGRGVLVMEPAEGRLACGTSGPGRLPEPEDIVCAFLSAVRGKPLLKGLRVLITAGPTAEAIDPVRFLTNRSSGKMGYALAKAARDMGADVTLVSGPVSLKCPSGIRTIHVRTALEMRDAVLQKADQQDIIIGCAAVADYRPERTSELKLEKSEELTIRLVKNPDILAELGADKRFFLVGFAAQTHDVEERAREKLRAKNLDMIVANDVSAAGIGMDADENEVTILRPGAPDVHIERAEKSVIARAVLGEIASCLGRRDA